MNAADIQVDDDTSFLLVGDSGTHKTWFIGTCPSPIYVFDLDKGMSIHRGRADIDFDTFKELPRGEDIKKYVGGKFVGQGWYAWGTAWPAILAKLNEIGRSIDTGECKYRTIAFDSLTLLTDVAQSYILRENNRTQMEQRDWGAFLSNMSALFSQLTGWPCVKVLTAHIRRDENQLTQVVEKLPLVPGQFSGKVPVLFDEVYYTNAKPEGVGANAKLVWTLQTLPDSVVKQAKSRKYNLPNGTATDFGAIMKYMGHTNQTGRARQENNASE